MQVSVQEEDSNQIPLRHMHTRIRSKSKYAPCDSIYSSKQKLASISLQYVHLALAEAGAKGPAAVCVRARVDAEV